MAGTQLFKQVILSGLPSGGRHQVRQAKKKKGEVGWGRDYNIKEKTTTHDAPHQWQQIQLMFSDSQDSFLPPLSMQFCVVLISPFLIVFGIERDVKVRGRAVPF